MNNDKMREGFEKFYRSHMTKEGQENIIINSTLNSYKNERDKYGYSDIQEMWITWKAARESLCIEFPRC